MVNVLQSMLSFFLSSFVFLCCVLRFLFFLFFYCLFVCFNNLRCKKLYLRLNENSLNPLLRKPITFLSYSILFICFLNNIYVSV